DAARLLLAHHREAEDLLIEVDRALQVGDLDAHVIDGGGLEIEFFLRAGGRATGSQDGETANQVATVERAALESGDKTGDDGFHISLLGLRCTWVWKT